MSRPFPARRADHGDALMKTHPCALNRRSFLRRAAAATTLPLVVPGSVLGLNGAGAPNRPPLFGTIGGGHRARVILPNFLSFQELRFVAVSDCRADRLKSAKQLID